MTVADSITKKELIKLRYIYDKTFVYHESHPVLYKIYYCAISLYIGKEIT